MPSDVALRVAGLSKEFHSRQRSVPALDNVSFDVRKGEFLTIVGPSGCGKTTMLRILAELDQHTSGDVYVRRELGTARPANAVVFQQESIFPWMTVEENISYGMRMQGVATPTVAAQTNELLDKTGLERFRKSHPHQLSGGMKQRVSIARAFAFDPEVLLMDEPLAALDEQTKFVLQAELLRLWESTNKTVVYITHSLDEALTLSDRILVMRARPGRIIAEIEVPFPRPRNALGLRQDPAYGSLIVKLWQHLGHDPGVAHQAEAGVGQGVGP